MTISPADPMTLYGAYGGLQVSRDGGKTWRVVGQPPAKLIDLAASAKDAAVLYAASAGGLSVSRDGGVSWETILAGAPVTMVEVTPAGIVYAFRIGEGLLKSGEDGLQFRAVGGAWGERFLLHLAAHPDDPSRLFAATGEGAILASRDGGETWRVFGETP
jgi:photosystem II stability/assembly factor-like uncharacterized protein